ncbi:helix-turn-helix domain-containing protein [Paenibacillus methanolicus]|uniref:DNA-binding Xre family transcriptional regulator n=1 Tax=Paenibacillus methanolicus TaxID=582686 RepID=A0A5S5BUQ1_9BACL|nr:helix-turn-helix domain-containing protein [Paenibacillus methanolicus]TYP70719.1 DNA-binding Xre family transcriptional regulator [Paenibacillus methanolicus]
MPVFKTIFDTMDTPMALLKGGAARPLFDRVNEAFVQLVGLSRQELDGNALAALFPGCRVEELSEGARVAPLQGRHEQPTRIKLSCRKLDIAVDSVWLLTAEDVSAAQWIERQSSAQPVLMSGIVEANYVISRLEKTPLAAVQDPPLQELEYLQKSILSIIHPDEQERTIAAIQEAARFRRSGHLTIRTKRLADAVDLEIRLLFHPFYDGSGELKQYAFVVTDLRPNAEPIDPAVKLKIVMARCNMSAQQLSETTGISVQTISKLRNGKIRKPQRLTAELIATELGVKPQEIWS